MNPTRRASEWIYSGVWAVLTDLFRVPRTPPELPASPGGSVLIYRPCEGWLNYRKIVFWILLLIIDVALFVPWAILFFEHRTIALWLAIPWFAVMVVPDVLAYVAIHLRYDTTWYVISERSMRLRRGVWSVHETTITFENVQNVQVSQGPLQRYFGFSDLVVQTAGGGGSAGKHGHAAGGGAHVGRIEGVEDPNAMGELIMAKVRASRAAGLGDEPGVGRAPLWDTGHIDALRAVAARSAALRAAAV
jgi:membrane protein YdbS with pleckstrin-like domain